MVLAEADGQRLMASESRNPAHVHLVNAFQLIIGNSPVSVPRGAQRVLAFLALARNPVTRSRVAGSMWSEVSEDRALGNLRTTLWRLGRVQHRIIDSIDDRLGLRPDVVVDLDELNNLSETLIDSPSEEALHQAPSLLRAAALLPDWDDDWLVVERERFHELRLRALERAGNAMLERGDTGSALQAALAAVASEPLRESAQRVLLGVHLREGNVSAAVRSYATFRELIAAELGLTVPMTVQEFTQGS